MFSSYFDLVESYSLSNFAELSATVWPLEVYLSVALDYNLQNPSGTMPMMPEAFWELVSNSTNWQRFIGLTTPSEEPGCT